LRSAAQAAMAATPRITRTTRVAEIQRAIDTSCRVPNRREYSTGGAADPTRRGDRR
jgi:hypothetical protein